MNEMPNGTGCVVASCGPLVDPVAPLAVNVFGCSRAALSLSLSFLEPPGWPPGGPKGPSGGYCLGVLALPSLSLSLSLPLGGSSSGALAAAPLFFYFRWVEGASVGLAHSHGLVGVAL